MSQSYGNGRGRGISNAPAWMMERGGGGGGPPPPVGDHGPSGRGDRYDSSRDRDRDRDGGGGGYYGEGAPYPPRNGGGGGGGDRRGSYNDDYPPPPYHRDHRGPPPPPHMMSRGGGGRYGGPPPPYPPPRRHPPPPGGHGPPPVNAKIQLIKFRSYEEEMDFVEDRRRKRRNRVSKFDVLPATAAIGVTPMMPGIDPLMAPGLAMALASAGTAVSVPGMASLDPALLLQQQPQQTRHARRLYVGNLPFTIHEQDIHRRFTDAIRTCLVTDADMDRFVDPVVSVYLNHEKRFAFVEFSTVEMATACMQLDGMELGGVPVKIKRPNDYNEAMALLMTPHLGPIPTLDVSRLGIVSSTVLDGPNKIFIGGLHYHLREEQVMELLSAFGKVKSFHLVKNESGGDSSAADPTNYSKGYCFVEYADPSVTPVAIAGLNGMDIGNGKSLTVRLAGGRPSGSSLPMVMVAPAGVGGAPGSVVMMPGATATAAASSSPTMAAVASAQAGGHKVPPPTHTVVTGYDVEELVDAALGRRPMPLAPTYFDVVSGIPLTRVVPALWSAASTALLSAAPTADGSASTSAGSSVMPSAAVVAAAVAAATAAAAAAAANAPPPSHNGMVGPPPPPLPPPSAPQNEYEIPTSVLVLHNMVTPADLATEEDHQGLLDEVRDECAKFGKLRTVLIPRQGPGAGKIYLQYSTVQEAQSAQGELQDRQFGDATVTCRYYSEEDFLAGRLA